jgi:hypothetical protein
MNIVYILEQGEDYEGGSILDIYGNKDSALRDLAECFNHRFDRFSKYLPEEFAVEMMPVWGEEGESFQSGCDYWVVSMREIHD